MVLGFNVFMNSLDTRKCHFRSANIIIETSSCAVHGLGSASVLLSGTISHDLSPMCNLIFGWSRANLPGIETFQHRFVMLANLVPNIDPKQMFQALDFKVDDVTALCESSLGFQTM